MTPKFVTALTLTAALLAAPIAQAGGMVGASWDVPTGFPDKAPFVVLKSTRETATPPVVAPVQK